jgi:hypothetical protein
VASFLWIRLAIWTQKVLTSFTFLIQSTTSKALSQHTNTTSHTYIHRTIPETQTEFTISNTLATIMEHHLTLKVISLILDMALINSAIEIDYVPPASKSTEIYLTALMTLIAAKNTCMPFPGPTPGHRPKEIQKHVINVSDCPGHALAPPTSVKCGMCLQDHLTTASFEISCGHVFCRQCALLEFSQPIECPVCSARPAALDEPESELSTQPAVDVAWELQFAKEMFIFVVAQVASLSLLWCLCSYLSPGPGAEDWKAVYHYNIVFTALYPGVKSLGRSLLRRTWWSLPLVLGLTSMCAVVATYDSAARYMDRTGAFWGWWSLPLMSWCIVLCFLTIAWPVANRYIGRDFADILWW